VDQERSLGGFVVGIHTTQEVQDGSSILGNTMVWPSCEMELGYLTYAFTFLCGIEVGKGETKTGVSGGHGDVEQTIRLEDK